MKRCIGADRGHRRGKVHSAFTLLELLVTVAVIAILASLLLPVLAKAKAKGQSILCLNNLRQLTTAWLLYADDFEDTLAYNLGEDEIRRLLDEKRFLNWTSSLLNWELDPENTNTVLLTQGGIGPYTAENAKIYRCPSDRALSDLQIQASWSARARSISMNAMIGDAGEYSAYGTNVNNPGYRQFFRLSQIPDPSQIFAFIEEHPDSVNDGYFINKAVSLEWTDLPASYHNGGANLAFADGHVEYHRWLLAGTKPPPRPDAAQLPKTVPRSERTDFDWLMERTSSKRFNYGKY